MAGFFSSLIGGPEQAQALGLLGAAMMKGRAADGFMLANQHMAEAPQRQLKTQLAQAQLQQALAEAQREQAALERSRRVQQAIPSLYRQPGMSGGEAVPQTMGGVPMFSQPMGAAPMRATPSGFDVQEALRIGMTPKEIQEYAGLTDIGRPKATRQMEVDDGKGGKRIALVDDFGREVAGFAGYTAPVQVNQGDRVSFVKPAPGVSLPMNMSPEARASNALGWANNALTRRGQDMADARARESNMAGRVPAGYRAKADGTLEFIPGGPADPNAAKKAAPTEFQGKAAMFGNRAAEADRIITSLQGKYSPMAVNTKLAADNAPWYLGGGVTGAAANLFTSDEAQMAEQAQRDFVNAVLRLESGAAVAESEFNNARKQYFPQPGDSASVIAQKAANRKRAIQGLMHNARTSSGSEMQSEPASPSVDDLLKKYGGK